MNTLIICSIVVAILIGWLIFDYKAGRKNHLLTSKYTQFPLRKSDISVFIDGNDFYKDYFENIKNSTTYVHVLFFIVKNDKISHEFLSILGDKAKEGLDVRLLLDYVGSSKLGKKKIQALKNQGVRIAFSHKPKLPFLLYTSQARNHRKITVIDGKTSYLGGFNIGKEYIGQDPKLGYWRDYHLKIKGEGVIDLQQQFLKDWFDSTGENDLNEPRFSEKHPKGESTHMFISTYGEKLEDHFIDFIQNAKQEIIICTPYFIPGKMILNELLEALSRGVKVKLVVPMGKDHPLVKEASLPYFGPLILAGGEIYQFFYGFFHAKVIIIDDKFCDIGTANFDKRSMYLNDEMNCLIYDPAFIEKVRGLIHKDMKHSELLTYSAYEKRPLTTKIKERFATMISHFL
ncbi:cardiolipin synthase [Metabacillus crassostreae]|uniref:cardiolipin synthase n=1 Tax=Metabacillus crassostreae TaxID=929098 RepID=UPI0019591C6F|nr:cardiolipin synthase [Metabacillus crassostreae]MBM7605275.1 cardiolipin synthase [Metabacillus crassostreae]